MERQQSTFYALVMVVEAYHCFWLQKSKVGDGHFLGACFSAVPFLILVEAFSVMVIMNHKSTTQNLFPDRYNYMVWILTI
jgi:hypothetical protein